MTGVMPELKLVDLDEEDFQGVFEGCGDSEPLGLVLDGEPIGLVLIRYDDDARSKLETLGIREE